jgi:hypothetical protein
MLGIGWCASKKNTDSEYYYLGGRPELDRGITRGLVERLVPLGLALCLAWLGSQPVAAGRARE